MIEKIFGKYQTLGGEIEKVHVEISKYKDEMTRSTMTLEEMYENNINIIWSWKNTSWPVKSNWTN